jgi:hypothetical protein
MEKLIKYRQIIRDVLISYTEIPYSHGELTCNPIFDESRDSFLLVTFGWDRKKRVHDSLIHVDIINDKIWIHCDDTEDGVATELVAAGIPASDIVLAFHPADVRSYTGYAIA